MAGDFMAAFDQPGYQLLTVGHASFGIFFEIGIMVKRNAAPGRAAFPAGNIGIVA